MMSSDTGSIVAWTESMYYIPMCVVVILFFSVFMYLEIGWIGLMVPLTTILVAIAQNKINKVIYSLGSQKMEIADDRSEKINEVISSIKSVKFNALEPPLIQDLNAMRSQERPIITKQFGLNGVLVSLATFLPIINGVICFWVIQLFTEQDLTSPQVYAILTIFNGIVEPTRQILFSMSQRIPGVVSMGRLEQLMSLPDREPLQDDPGLKQGTLLIREGSFTWVDPKIGKDVLNEYKGSSEGSELEDGNQWGRSDSILDATPHPSNVDWETSEQPLTERLMHSEAANGAQRGQKAFLKDIDLRIRPGEFVAVVGRVGAGKTSLALAMMNEMYKISGKVSKNGRISYLPQEAFLLNDTVRNNIIFGSSLEFDQRLYDKAIETSELEQDLLQLPGGDLTQIGERGINLSGGQKQRVAVARAVYSRADIFIVDDTLSALDLRVGRKVLNNVFMNQLHGTTRIMITHDLKLLGEVDRVILLKEGSIVEDGEPHDVMESEEFKFFAMDVMDKEALHHSISDEDDDEDDLEVENDQKRLKRGQNKNSRKLKKSGKGYDQDADKDSLEDERRAQNDQLTLKTAQKITNQQDEQKLLAKGKLNKIERKNDGGITRATVRFYFSKIGPFFTTVLFFTFSLSIALKMYTDYFVGVWMSKSFNPNDLTYPVMYVCLGAAIAVLFLLRSIIYGTAVSKAAILIFEELLNTTLRRPMSFFDTTHSGQILNRCVGDINEVDSWIPTCMFHCILCVLSFLGTFILMVLISPWNLLIVFGFLFYFWKSLVKFNKTKLEIERMKKVSKSTLTGIANEMISGSVVIRQHDCLDFLWERFKESVDFYSVINCHGYIGHCWITVRIKYSSALVVSLLVLVIASNKQFRLLNSEDVNVFGIALTYLNNLMVIISVTVWSCSATYRAFSGIERLMEYCVSDDLEKEWDQPSPRGQREWPDQGVVEFVGVKARYREGLPLVLKGVSFKVKPKEKVALVGRTGSGKSTIFLTLMRLIELPEDLVSDECCIMVDGNRIDQVGLHHVRRGICVISQDPFLVEGTIRANIDLFDSFEDEKVIEVLKKVGFFETLNKGDLLRHVRERSVEEIEGFDYNQDEDGAAKKPIELQNLELSMLSDEDQEEDPGPNFHFTWEDLLSYDVESKGSNLSLGQRQLLCLARALLGNPKILLMDEATASIDQKTDQILQRVIRDELLDTTVLTIAHRLNTIINYDRVLILDEGVVVREGTPLELLEDSESTENWFRDIVKETGEDYYQMMRGLANELKGRPDL